jgi:hypothetical protein
MADTAPAPAPFKVPATTFAGFTPQNIAEYFGVNTTQAAGLIALGNGAKVTALAQAERDALAKLNPKRFKPGATTYNQGFGDIVWGLNHLAQHPAGSHYHGDFNVTDLVANIATGGLYAIGKAGFNFATGQQNALSAVKTGFASYGPAGSALQPTVGTNKALLIEATVATAAIVPKLASLLGPALGLVENTGKSLFATYIAGGDVTGAPGPAAPSNSYTGTGAPTYLLTGSGAAPAFNIPNREAAPSGPAATLQQAIASPGILALLALGIIGLVWLKRRTRS